MHNRIMELLKDKFWMTEFLLFVNPIYANTMHLPNSLYFMDFIHGVGSFVKMIVQKQGCWVLFILPVPAMPLMPLLISYL